MAIPLQHSESLSGPATASLTSRLKNWCTRVLAPDAYAVLDEREFSWTGECLARADELTHQLNERYSLFVGLHREGLLVANLLANRFGAALSELEAFASDTVWQSGQVKHDSGRGRVLVIVPPDPQFSEDELRALEAQHPGTVVEVTSIAPGAPILPVETVAALAHGPRSEDARARPPASA